MIQINDKTITCVGDIHGEFSSFRYKLNLYINKYHVSNNIFIICGDCGFFGENYDKQWFDSNCKKPQKSELYKIINLLEITDNYLYLFRGNHDNPFIFNDEYITKNKTNRIKVLNDYDILQSNIYGNILIIPGAFSIDRCGRKQNKDWWEEENIKILSNEELNKFNNINIILSHSLPFQILPLSLYKMFKEEDDCYNFKTSFDENLNIQENYLRKIFKIISPKTWISGHYHKSFNQFFNKTKLVSISIMEFYNLNY